MKTWLTIALLIAVSASADDKAPRLLDSSEKSNLSMSAHEIKGVDRKALSVVIDEEDSADLSLSGVDGSRAGWREKIERTTEEMSWW